MSDKTDILWTDSTWNPVTGCSKVSAGCKNCYALRDWARLALQPGSVYFGRQFTDVALHPERLSQPLRWTRPRRIFVNSMSDLFHEAVPDAFIDQVFAVMGAVLARHATPHIFQVLTKRVSRMHAYLGDPDTPLRVRARMAVGHPGIEAPAWPFSNVWVGVSVEDQASANERLALLSEVDAAVRWVSMEPLLAAVDITFVLRQHRTPEGVWRDGKGLDWVVAGGESGPGARPLLPDWVRNLRDQCVAAGVPFAFKQWGEWAWVADGQVIADESGRERFFDEKLGATFERKGTHATGRTLDGVEWEAYPEEAQT